jgi:signal transduction histidine kinase
MEPRRLVRSYWPELLWAAFAAANAAAMVLFHEAETVPFHFIWVSLTILYGLRVWSILTTAYVLAATMVVTGLALGHAVIGHPQGWDELTEVPLMASMFGAMVWHARRRQSAMDELRRTHERERDFIRDASHLLRTPITVAQGHVELLLNQREARRFDEDLRVVLDELRTLGTMSDRLLLLATAKSPRFLQRAPVDIGGLVRDAVVRWRPSADRDWRVEVRADGVVSGDEERLRAALDALIENAVRATAPRDRISVAVDPDGDAAVVEVSDTGAGIEPEDLSRIFDRFSTVRSPRRGERHRGTGLGLPIVKAIVDAHHGSIVATSDPGKSTTLRIRLPGFQRAPAYPQEAEMQPAQAASASSFSSLPSA